MRSYAGDTALPGGKYEPGDRSLEETARREAFEEVVVLLHVSIFSLSRLVDWSSSRSTQSAAALRSGTFSCAHESRRDTVCTRNV
jgi:8-oxo-dGTP pyrophosphatase MutT (NUDIX family)